MVRRSLAQGSKVTIDEELLGSCFSGLGEKNLLALMRLALAALDAKRKSKRKAA